MTPDERYKPSAAMILLAARVTHAAVLGSRDEVAVLMADVRSLDPIANTALLLTLSANVARLLQVIDPDGWEQGLTEALTTLTLSAEEPE